LLSQATHKNFATSQGEGLEEQDVPVAAPKNYFPFLPMDGYFFFTAALTFAFSVGVPDCATRARAFLACASFSIGYFRLSGSAKDFVGSAFRAAPESFAICHPIIRDKDL
jgi:hypothetical protein